jgi:hypothetical protein
MPREPITNCDKNVTLNPTKKNQNAQRAGFSP